MFDVSVSAMFIASREAMIQSARIRGVLARGRYPVQGRSRA